MSLLDLFGVGKSITDAQSASTQILQQISPIVDEAEERFNGVIANNLNRLDGATIKIEATCTINLKPYPVAEPVNPS